MSASLPIHHVEQVMGMPVSFDIRLPVPPVEAVREAVTWLHHVDATFSTYRDDSPITRLGRDEITLEDVTDEVRLVLTECHRLNEVTNGAFDAFDVPAVNGTRLDPSGLVKGWAIQKAAAMLEEAGAVNYCINAAGDIALGGQPEPGRGWVVGIRHPYQADKLATTLHLSGPTAVATSAALRAGRSHHRPPRRNASPVVDQCDNRRS